MAALLVSVARGQAVHAGSSRSDATPAMAPASSPPSPGVMFPAPGTRPAGSVHGRRPADGEASFDDQPGREIEDARAKQKDWEFALAPYLWLLSVSADVKAGPISAGKDVCVTDLLRNLDMIAQLRFEGLHKQRWGFFLDGTYIGLSTEARAKVGPFKLRGLDVDAELRLAWLDFGAMYRFGRSGRSFDAFLGGRVAHVSTALSLGPFVNSAGDSDFVSPVIGGRFERAFSERWIGSLKGEVGGFGVQGADLYWGATAALGYRLTKHATLEVGYRVYDWNYRQGRRELDLTFHGPIIGLVFRF